MNSRTSNTKKRLAEALKDACQDFDIKVMELSKSTETSFQNWYKRLSGDTEIKLVDLLIICESTGIDVIKFLTYIITRYYKNSRSDRDQTGLNK